MPGENEPKIDKRLLSRVCQFSKIKYLEQGNCDGSLYLSPEEMIARAYVEAFKDVLVQQGFEIRRVSKK